MSGGTDVSRSENSTRRQMEAAQLPNIKGKKGPKRPSYTTREGSVGLLGMAGRSTSQAPDAYSALAILRAKEASGGIVLDPVGRLVPPLKVPTFDENEISYIELHPFLSAVLGSISRLSTEDASALYQAPEAKSACLELNVDAETAAFRWSADGKEHWVRFEHPGGTLTEVLGKEPPACQTVTKLYFPLLFAVGRLFAATSKHGSADPVPSSGEAPASADPEKETPPRPGRRPSVTGPATAEPGHQHPGKYGEGEKSSSPYRCHRICCMSQLLDRDTRPDGLPRRPDYHLADPP